MSTSSPPQKDYHPLNNHHAHLNRLKTVNNNNNNNNNSNNSLNNSNHHSISNSNNGNNNNNNINNNKTRPPSVSLIVDGPSVMQQQQQPQQQTQQQQQHQLQPIGSTVTTTNVAMFVNNHHYHHHHHHHQHHIHQHASNNNSISNGSSISSGRDTASSLNVRKSYSGSDPSNVSFSSASVSGSIQDDMSDQCGLTQAGLEEYNSRSYYDQPVFHHQKQSSYAQSEGYHSYVSSSDSSSATPFLDRLRQESELLSRQSHHWSQNDLSPTSNNNSSSSGHVISDNNSSESTSSTETLKWLGSMSDVSVASHATNSSAISGSVSSSQLIVHSSRVRTPKRHNSESVLYMNDDQMSVTSESNAINTVLVGNNNTAAQAIYHHQIYHHQQPLPPPTSSSSMKVIGDLQNSSSLSSSGATGSPISQSLASSSSSSSSSSLSSSSAAAATATSTVITATSSSSSLSSSSSSSSSYRNNHRLFPVSTYSEPVNGSGDYQPHQYQLQQQPQPQTQTQQLSQPPQSQNQNQQQQQHPQPPPTPQQLQLQHHQQQQQQQHQKPGMKLSSPQSHNWQSVAERISDFERQQQHLSAHHHHVMQQQALQKYTYIDPSKTHRVPNPALKAFQKNAVQSYFERQQHNAKENSKNYSNSNNINSRPQSLQLLNSPKEVPMPQMRSSLPNNYAVQNMNLKNASAQQILNSSLIIQQISDDSLYTDCGVPPPPPPRSRSLMPVRRSSSASEYADFRDHFVHVKEKQIILSEQHLNTVSSPEKSSFNDCGVPPPPPPPRGRNSMPVRRTSSASEYAAFRDKNIQTRQNLSKDLLGPIIMGPIISVDDWVPERPPKNPHLRIPSPDLPPPPVQIVDTEVNLTNQDEPLPPPPPEILRHVRQNSESEKKPPSPSRRNSFAGSPSRKTLYRASTFENLSPPSVPKKPSPMDLMQIRPASSLAQSHKAHKVILNGKLETAMPVKNHQHLLCSSPAPPQLSQDQQLLRPVDARMSIRKRAHNPHPQQQITDIKSPVKMNLLNMKSPPPLKPRMPLVGQEMRASSVAINSKLRCNSKASYLPRQSRDKLNATDPDHGSYKLTLTSNEDSINHNTTANYHEDILSAKCNNLPDVLPVGVKMQPSSPSSSASSPRYGSNNNINSTPPHTAPAIIPTGYPMKSMFHFQTPVSSHQRHNNSPTPMTPPSYSMTGLNRSPNSPHHSGESISPKYMSQSTIDLKKTHIIEASDTNPGKMILSPAQSESNINSQDKMPSSSPYSNRREFKKIDVVRKLSMEEHDCGGEGRIVRAELVNTTLSSSPSKSEEKMIIRKDSLRENIEKITQLQSKLMSAHIIENNGDRKLLGYSAKTVEIKSKSTIGKETPKPASTLLSSPASGCHSTKQQIPENPEAERISQMDSETDGLKLMQRTEIVLRLNAPTTEAASQTDDTLERELSRLKLSESKEDGLKSDERLSNTMISTKTILTPRKKHPEEVDCDSFSKDLVDLLSPTDKLCNILAPKVFKTSSDYVSGLYNPNVALRPAKRDVGTSTPNDKSIGCELTKAPSLENLSSEHKTNGKTTTTTTTRYNREMLIVNGDACDLTKKKEELVDRISKKLLVLGNEQKLISEESSINDQLGSDLAAKVAEKVRPIDATKFRTYIDDVGHITMLLLSLSGRLARAENDIHNIDENHADKKILQVKRDRLLEQLDEAKRLKDDIDRRGTIVGKILEKNLPIDEYADYDCFINMKAKLIVDSREIADKIKLSEDQLAALRETLGQSDC